MNIRNFFYVSYWFSDPNIVRSTQVGIWVAVFLIFIALGILAVIIRRFTEKKISQNILERFSSFFFANGFGGIFLFIFREQGAPFLDWRIWFLLLAILDIIWLYRLFFYTFKRYPEIKAENKARAQRAEYLPQAKR